MSDRLSEVLDIIIFATLDKCCRLSTGITGVSNDA